MVDKGAVLEIINRFELNAQAFITDFRERKGSTYLCSELPALNNLSGKYDKVVMSNLLNAYSDEAGPQDKGVHFTHKDTLQSFLNLVNFVAPNGELSVFPHTTGRHEKAPYYLALRQALSEKQFVIEEPPIGKIDFIYSTPEHWRSVLKIKTSSYKG